MSWSNFFRQTLSEAERDHARRRRTWHVDLSSVVFQRADGRQLINFATNDYLGLRHDSRLIAAVQRSVQVSGVGAGASPLVSGYNLALAELEQRLADWQGTEASLVFSSGMSMNIGVIAALVGSRDLVLSDQRNHASLIDGCRLSGAQKQVFAHNDLDQVRDTLKRERGNYRRVLVVTESIFSMDGDQAPLAELSQLCQAYDAGLLVDEAHGTGVFGRTGAGVGELVGATTNWLGKLGTLSKAIGTSGGFIAGSRELIDFLVNRCRSYIFSTAIAPPVVAATIASIALIPGLNDRREKLHQLSQSLRTQLQTRGWQVPHGDSPIVPVIVGSNESALALSRRLLDAGLYVPAIRPPTVPAGQSRLRISLSAAHQAEHIDRLVDAMSKNLLSD